MWATLMQTPKFFVALAMTFFEEEFFPLKTIFHRIQWTSKNVHNWNRNQTREFLFDKLECFVITYRSQPACFKKYQYSTSNRIQSKKRPERYKTNNVESELYLDISIHLLKLCEMVEFLLHLRFSSHLFSFCWKSKKFSVPKQTKKK